MPKELLTAKKFIPENPTLPLLQSCATGCTACHLYKLGTQTVFGEGKNTARVFLVGEQPGDKEDLAGKPFVGPAGQLLNTALEQAGIDRDSAYVTNIVKHFKWEPRGKRRIHKKPNAMEIAACRPWFEAELKVIRPDIVICLGATAAQAVIAKDFKVTQRRGELMYQAGTDFALMATVHPSSILRAPDDAARHQGMKDFIADLKIAAAFVQSKEKRAA